MDSSNFSRKFQFGGQNWLGKQIPVWSNQQGDSQGVYLPPSGNIIGKPVLGRPILSDVPLNGGAIVIGGTTNSDKATFKFTELQDLFQKKGLDELLNELKNLQESGAVENIKVKTDATTGKTTVSCDVDGVTYEFTGVKNESVSQNSDSVDDNGTFKTKDEMHEFLLSNDGKKFVASKFPNGVIPEKVSYEQVCINLLDKYGDDVKNITKEQLAADFVYEYNLEAGEIEFDAPTNQKGVFKTPEDIAKYLYSDAGKDAVWKALPKDAAMSTDSYSKIVDSVLAKHANDLSDLSQEQVVKEFVAIYSAPAEKSDSVSPEDGTGVFKSQADIAKYLRSEEGKKAVYEALPKDTVISPSMYDTFVNNVWNQHTKNFESLTKEQIVKEFVEEYKASLPPVEQETEPETGVEDTQPNEDVNPDAGDEAVQGSFNSYAELYTYLAFDNEASDAILALNPDVKLEFAIADTVAGRHQDDFASVTKEQLVKEYVAEYIKQNVDVEADNTFDKFTITPDEIKEAAGTLAGKIDQNLTESEINMISHQYPTIHTEFGIDKDGNIKFEADETTEVYQYVKDQIVTDMREKYPDVVNNLDTNGLENLLQAAWINTYNTFDSSQTNNTKEFLQKVVSNLKTMLTSVSNDYRTLDIYTKKSNYADKSLTSSLVNYDSQDVMTYSDGVKFADGSIHINDNESDKMLQATMSDLLKNLKAKYSVLLGKCHISEAQLADMLNQALSNALDTCVQNKNDCPYGTDNGGRDRVGDDLTNWYGGRNSRAKDHSRIYMNELIQMVLYNFDKILYDSSSQNKIQLDNNSEIAPAPENNTEKDPVTDPDKTVVGSANFIKDKMPVYLQDSEINMIARQYPTMHTEFGIDKDGDLRFESQDATEVYQYVKDQVVNDIAEAYPDKVKDIGGKDVLASLVQVAWISTYNTFDSSQRNNTKDFLNKMVENLKDILNKVSNDPKIIEIYTQHTNYADKTLTDDLVNYDSTSALTYSLGDVYGDGTVHLQDTQSDMLYQATMSALLPKLRAKYPGVSQKDFDALFQKAQLDALANCVNNVADCPYGTDNGGQDRVGDDLTNWHGGRNSRAKDRSRIQMNELVQMVLYNLDKLLYSHVGAAKK